jgi:hypothetical protein
LCIPNDFVPGITPFPVHQLTIRIKELGLDEVAPLIVN